MRILYFILYIVLPYALRVFYPRVKVVNSPKEFRGRTIYVSNHASSFMDPLVVATFRRPIVFFMTRSDVFNKKTQPILWASHMLPIYREQDGEDTKQRNEEVFKKCTQILSHGRNLLLFSEGFTDDTFIRRLKPVKKGAIRIGFGTLEEINWEKKVYVSAVGCNYSNPGQMRTDILISTSKKICLNDFKEEYLENPNKVVTLITKRVEEMMKEQITHVENKDNAPFHEHIMMITRKGMNPDNFDRSISLEKRWRYSQNLANWMNAQDFENNEELTELKEETDNYFKLLKRFKIQEHHLFWKKSNPSGSRMKEILMLLILFPFVIIGFFHCALPYFLVKGFVEKSFRRKVFWSSVKLILGMISIAVFNIPFIFMFYYFIYPSWLLAIAYFFTIGLTGLAAYMWFKYLKEFKIKALINKMDLSKLFKKRDELEAKINKCVPTSFD